MLRPATDADLPAMLAWRNQRANRLASLTQHVISAEEHAAWWARTGGDPSRRVLIFSHAERPLGVVTFGDITDREASWGFYLDHESTTADGIALLAWTGVMREAVGYAFAEPPDGLGVERLTGEVLAENEAVRAMNRRFGFTEQTPRIRPVGGALREVVPISRQREGAR
ncbi:MAG: GNAT family N-acetyltransferase [Nocardioides sp.]|uniref:GNAT family N-acetyltransferase n=1 Tax=Nocardioides sp. TaxID=35761 RepID=UPI0039E710E8